MITLDNKTFNGIVSFTGRPRPHLFLLMRTRCNLFNSHDFKVRVTFTSPVVSIAPSVESTAPQESPAVQSLAEGELSKIQPAIELINTAVAQKSNDVVLSFSRFSKKLSSTLYECGLIESYRFMGADSIKLVFKYENVVEPTLKSHSSSGHAGNTSLFLLINEPNTPMTQEQFTTFSSSKPKDELYIYILNKGISFYTNQEVDDASISACLVCTIKIFRRRS